MSYFEQTKLTRSDGTVINPVEDESIGLLRRITKQLESNATVDYANRQRVVLDSLPGAAVTTAVPVSGTFWQTTQAVSISQANAAWVPVDQRYQCIDAARMAYAVGIRNNLIFS